MEDVPIRTGGGDGMGCIPMFAGDGMPPHAAHELPPNAAPPAEETFTGPLETRLRHAQWNARRAAYEELQAKLEAEQVPGDWYEYLKSPEKEKQAAVLEQMLACLVTYLKVASSAEQAAAVLPGVFDKGLGCIKPKAQAAAQEIACLAVENGAADAAIEHLTARFAKVKGVKHKQALAATLTKMFSEFGAGVFDLKACLPVLVLQLADKDNQVRSWAKTTVRYLHVLHGGNTLVVLEQKGVSSYAIAEMTKDCESTEGLAQPTRALKGKEVAVLPDPAAGATSAAARAASADDLLYDTTEPEAVLKHIPKDYWTVVHDPKAKWAAKRALMEDTLLALVSKPRLQPDDYHDLTKSLKRQLADPNVAMVALTCKVLLKMCVGLRVNYSRDARILFPALLDLQKEKKITVQEPLKEILFALYTHSIVRVEDVVDDITKASADKVLQVRSGVMHWMERCVSSSRNPDEEKRAVKTMKVFAPIAVKRLECDADSAVKTAAANVLGAYYRLAGEDGCTFLAALSQKLRERVAAAAGKQGGSDAATNPRSAPSSPVSGAQKRPNTARLGSPRAKTAKTAKNSSATLARHNSGTAGKKGPAESSEAPIQPMSSSDAEAALAGFLGEDQAPALLASLRSKAMKERIEGVKALAAALESIDVAATSGALEAASATVYHAMPGWKDSCFMVVAEAVKMLLALVTRAPSTPPRTLGAVLPVCEKLQDAKLKGPVKELLTALCEALSAGRVIGGVVATLSDTKSPKAHQEGLDWLATMAVEFGPGTFDEKAVLQYALKCVEVPTPAVKNASCQLFAAVARCVGGAAVTSFVSKSDLRADLVKKVEEEVDKVKVLGGVAPKRVAKNAPAPAAASSLDEARDIRPLLSSALLDKLSNASWSTRCEALDELLKIVKRKMKADVGPELVPALKQRLTDPNKNIIPPTCNVIAEMFMNIGPPCRHHATKLMGSVLMLLGDQKPTVRQGARKVLNAYDSVCGLDGLLPFLPKAMATEVPAARQELTEFLVTVFNRDAGKLPPSSLQPTVQHLVAFLQDRHPTTRKLAEEMLKPLIDNVGYDSVMKHVGNLGAANQRALQPILDKNKFIGNNSAPQAAKAPAKRGLRSGATPKETGQPAQPPAPENDENSMKPPPKPVAKSGNAVPKHVDPLCPPMEGSGHGFRLPEAEVPVPETPMLPRQMPVITAVTSVAEATECLVHPDASVTVRAIEHIQAHRATGGHIEMDTVVLQAMSRLTTICTDSHVPLDLPTAKALVAFMMDIFTPPQSMACKTETMFFLIGALLDNLLTEKLHLMYRDEKSTDTQKRESDETLRCLNSLMLKLLERSGRTQTYCALIKRLDLYNKLIYQESHRYVKYVELVAKCLLKLIRFVTTESCRSVPGQPATDFTQLVAASHSFLIDNPPTNFKGKMELPLRTVKTLINELVKVKGESIRECLLELNINDNALIAEFINMCLENAANQAESGVQEAHVQAQACAAAPAAPEPVAVEEALPAAGGMDPQLSKRMDEIFARVRKTETSKEGVRELFTVLKEHPGLDPTPWMSECSVPFQGFLQRQLATLESVEKSGQEPPVPQYTSSNNTNNMQTIRERMNRVRQERQRGGDA